MEKFTTLTAVAAYYPRANVDTDLIIRVERCAKVPKNGLGKYAFEMARFLADGSDNPEFPLNNGPFRQARRGDWHATIAAVALELERLPG